MKKQHFNWNILSEIIGIVLCIICIPFIALNLTVFIKGLTSHGEVPTVFNLFEVIEANNLMAGDNSSIKQGDLLFFKKGDTDYKVGEKDGTVVAIIAPDNTVMVRRLISSFTAEDGTVTYVADSDNSQSFTKVEITADDIEGVYAGRIAGIGNVILFSHRPFGTFVIGVLPLVILFIALYLNARKENAWNGVGTTEAVSANRRNGGEKVIAEYDVYIDECGKQVVKRVKK